MSFAERLNDGRFAVALEITPPQKALPAVLLRRAGLLGELPHAVNVIQRPGRQSSLDASIELLGAGIAPTWHVVTRGSESTGLVAAFERARATGVRQLLAIRGDHAGEDSPATPSIREAIAMARDAIPGATIGATLNQYAPDRQAVLRNLVPKFRAGASYAQTQPVFELESLRPLAEAMTGAAADARLVAMVMPLRAAEVAKIQERLGVALPAPFVRRLEQGGDAAAWEAFAETLAALREVPWIHGLAVMTFGMDPEPETGERICTALRAAGCIED